MKYLFRAKDEDGNLVYGSVVYGKPVESYWAEHEDKTHFFVADIEYTERWEVTFDEDGYPEDEYYDNWDVGAIDIDWNTLEFNLNGQWIKYEVKE